MNEDGTDAEIVGHGYRNSYEQAMNSFCDMYQNDNDDHSSCRNSYILEYGSAGYFTRDGQKKYQSRPGEKIPSAHWRQLTGNLRCRRCLWDRFSDRKHLL